MSPQLLRQPLSDEAVQDFLGALHGDSLDAPYAQTPVPHDAIDLEIKALATNPDEVVELVTKYAPDTTTIAVEQKRSLPRLRVAPKVGHTALKNAR